MRHSCSLVFIAQLALAACHGTPSRPRAGQRDLAGPLAAPNSPLFLHFPSLDQRIARLQPGAARPDMVFYPDFWHPDTRAVRDYLVNERHLFALLSTSHAPSDSHLYAVDLSSGKLVRTLRLPPRPRTLAWSPDGRLLVGHFTATIGPPGRLSVVRANNLTLLATVDLAGGALSIASGGSRAFVIERLVQTSTDDDIATTFGLAEVDLTRGKAVRRMALPAGARQVIIGPSGLLYVSHASALGVHATDGTVSVIDPDQWQIIERLRLDMSVRRMVATHDVLVLNLLSRSGESWFGVVQRDHTTPFDFRFPALMSGELAVVDDMAYLATREGHPVAQIDLNKPKLLAHLPWPKKMGQKDPIALMRTVIAPRGDHVR